MTVWTLIGRSLRFHARAHIGVLLGTIIGSGALTGALLVGDSVRETLREIAEARLGPVRFVLSSRDRLFQQTLAKRVTRAEGMSSPMPTCAALVLEGTVARQDGSARANRIQVLAVDATDWPVLARWNSGSSSTHKPQPGEALLQSWKTGDVVFVNRFLADQLRLAEGDEVIVRFQKPSALAQDAVISPRSEGSVAVRTRIGAVLSSEQLGDFSLLPAAAPPATLFFSLEFLQQRLDLRGRANLLLVGGTDKGGSDSTTAQQLAESLKKNWQLADAQIVVSNLLVPGPVTNTPRQSLIEVSSPRIFLDPQVVAAALKQSTEEKLSNPEAIVTYLANLISKGKKVTPYSMVTAAGAPFVEADMKDNEIVVNEWLAEDLELKPGDQVELSYYVIDSASHLMERTNHFIVRSIVPIQGIYADRTLMPEFPGLAKAESTQDWDAGFPLIYKIREKDESYWKTYRGTPKAFITLAAGQKMWANRFGSLTAIRFPPSPGSEDAEEFSNRVTQSLRARLSPEDFGLRFEPVREQAMKAASQSQDFGQLFLGFSIFLVVSALLLTAMLFQFGLEQRMSETGTLLSLGFRPRQIRRLLLAEGVSLAVLGGVVGTASGVAYARAMLWALKTIWRNAVGPINLELHAAGTTLVAGFFTSAIVAGLTIFLALRKQARQSAVSLLAGEVNGPKRRARGSIPWVAFVAGAGAAGILVWAFATGKATSAEAFFSAGSLLLIAGISLISSWLSRLTYGGRTAHLTLTSLGVRSCARRGSRSLMTVALLACGCFVIASIGVFRLDSSREAGSKDSGTGGFALLGESSLPVVQDLNTKIGRESFGLNDSDLVGVNCVPFRVHDGDDASCLNLNRAQKPRLLGVRPELLAGRFSFNKVISGASREHGWKVLSVNSTSPEHEIAAVGDANSIQWALGKKVGDTLDYTDEYGRTFKLRLAGAVANSILQGNLIIDEAEFVRLFPSESGYRFFLIDAPASLAPQVSADLSRALQDQGLEMVSTVKRLDAFNAVQNTYLGTFQILGGLGLLLGSAGVGVVLLRNVLERRGELAVLIAAGFRRRRLRWLLLSEHAALLALGIGLGLVSAAVAVLPAIISRGQLPYASLAVTLGTVILNGLLWVWLASGFAMRGNLLAALRNE